MPAAATPWSPRAKIRNPSFGAAAANTDATVKAAIDHANSFRRPITSAIRPAGASSAAYTTV
jgi:hypothetical protein